VIARLQGTNGTALNWRAFGPDKDVAASTAPTLITGKTAVSNSKNQNTSKDFQ